MTFTSGGTIAGRLFTDSDGDNTENLNTGGYESGLAGLRVELYKVDSHGNKTFLGHTTTDAHGGYRFEGLSTSSHKTYVVKFPTNVNGETLIAQNVGAENEDSDADESTGFSDPIPGPKTSGSYSSALNVDAGYTATPTPDGAVDGEASGEVMELGYDDSNAPTNQGGDIITNDADLIYGNGGDDTISGEGGNDTIYGDSGEETGGSFTGPRESFNWDLVSSHQAYNGVTQDTGDVMVTYSRTKDTGSHNSDVDNSTVLNVAGIDGGGEVVDTNSSLMSETDGKGNTGEFQWEFSEPVGNVEFNINDLDGDGFVTVTAFDANGNAVPVTLIGGSDVVINGNTADADGSYQNVNDPDTTVQVTIAGPISKLVVEHTQDGHDNSGIHITDIFFDTGYELGDGDGGDDVITGGAGADMMYGEGGDDTFLVGNSADADGDVVDGGNGPDENTDNDVLDLRGAGRVVIDAVADPDDNGAQTGTATFQDGSVLSFSGIETILTDPFNEGPKANDDEIPVDEDDSVTFNPTLNDTDGDGDPLEVVSIGTPANGTLTDNGDGTYTYTPNENFNGTDSVTYTVSDGNGGTDTGTITFNVTPVNDDPVANNDSDSTDFETPVVIDLLANDTDVDGDTLTVVSATVPASQGTLTPTGTEGQYTFTPADDFEGTATVSYIISDGNGGFDNGEHTIEVGADPTPPDGVVDGEEFGENMGPGYNDENAPTDGGGDQIDGDDGDDDVIEGNGGDDTINAGQGSDTVSGGTGNDSIEGGASPDGDDLSGDEGDDTVRGGGGDDTIDGGEGDDVLDGGADDDIITGGDGNDSVIGGDGNDTIDTGIPGTPDAGFPAYGPFPAVAADADPNNDKDTVEAGEGDDLISTGDDADLISAGRGNDTVDAGIDDDTVDGGDGDDVIIGSEGNDSLFGGQGNDTIYGGLDPSFPDAVNIPDDGFGAPFGPDPDPENNKDFIDGGAGDDVIFGQDDDDTILGGTGNDTIDGGVDDDSISGGAGDDSLLGDHGDDFIQGNFGDDTLVGGRGSDTLEGNGDNDLIIGGAGDSIIGGGDSDTIIIDQDEVDGNGDNDTAIYVDGSTNGDDRDTLDLSGFVSYRNLVETVDSDGDSTSGSVEVKNDEGEWVPVTFAEIETLILPEKEPDGIVDGEDFGEVMNPGYDDSNAPTDGGGDQIDGIDGDDDSIRGNGGDDIINAGEGNDTVDGGDDDDSILGGNGDDIIEGGQGDDTVRGEDGNDTVSGGIGDDSVTGGAGDDVLDGGDGNDSLTGGSGDDTIDGGLRNDSITGSTGNDSITDLDGDNLINSDNPGSFNPDLGTPIGTPAGGFAVVAPDPDPNDNKDTITTGDGNDTIVAGDDADLIDAGNGNNVVDGGTDRDTITTGSGNDNVVGGEGDDLIETGDGDDTITGGTGNPAANFIDEPNDGFFGDPILDNGDDTINAGAGNDVVYGEDDNDLIDGGAGNDTLDGGIDDDTITGGDGDDVIIGGQGADSLEGGFGDDVFNVGTFTDPNGSGDYQEGVGDIIVGGEDLDDGDTDTLDLSGSGSLKVVYDDAVDPGGEPGESGTVIFYTDATQTEESGRLTFKEIENVIPCFTPGAMIATPKGEVPVESLREGDRVITRDNGIQEIRWTGSRTLDRQELAEHENMKPILIKAGSLGHNLPERDMLVSPQHRVLISGETPQLYFEESEVLVAAKLLVGKQGISVMDTLRTTYIHFMFDRHEVVLSDGAWTESFQPGDQSLGSMGEATRDEIFALFPELATEDGLTDYVAARRSLKAHEAKLLQL